MIDEDRAKPPILPAPPRPQGNGGGFTPDYFSQQYRWLEGLVRYITGVNYGRFNSLYLPGLPKTGYGLLPDEVFSNGGVLTVVQVDDIWIGPLTAAGEVGRVTVTV